MDPPLQSHEKASKYWRDSVARKSRDPSHQVSLHAWILYILGFILTGDLCNSWKAIEGIAAQLSHLSIAIRLGIAENAAFAIAYDCEVRDRTQRMARRRDSAVDSGKYIIGENDGAKRYLKSLGLGKGRVNVPGATTFGAFRKKSNTNSDPKGAPKGNGKPSGVNNKGETTPCVHKQKERETKNEEPPQTSAK